MKVLSDALEHGRLSASVSGENQTHNVDPQVLRVIEQALHSLAATDRITIETLPKNLTSTTAADVLRVSRPTLMKMARAAEIDSFKVGAHTGFTREAVLTFKAQAQLEPICAPIFGPNYASNPPAIELNHEWAGNFGEHAACVHHQEDLKSP